MTLEQNNDVAIARLDVRVGAPGRPRRSRASSIRACTPNVSYERRVSREHVGDRRRDRRPARADRDRRRRGADRAGRRGPAAASPSTSRRRVSRPATSSRASTREFPSALSATYMQPLFRGRAIDADRRNILLARRAVDLTDAQLTQVVMDQLTLVEQAYWDLAFAVRNLEVLASALEQARAQVRATSVRPRKARSRRSTSSRRRRRWRASGRPSPRASRR